MRQKGSQIIGFSKPGASHENPRFHRVVSNDWGTSRPCLLPPLAVKSKPPALWVVVDSAFQLPGLPASQPLLNLIPQEPIFKYDLLTFLSYPL
jgi:hypothetical protein